MSAGRTARRTAGQVAGQTAGQTAGRTAGQTAGLVVGQVVGQTAGQVAGQSVGQVVGQVVGQTAGQVAGQSVGQTAGSSGGQGRGPSGGPSGRRAGAVLGWSALNNVGLRLGGLALGIVLARLLGPEQFGTYAVALTVQALLMSVADFGLSADLIRAADPERRAATVATLALVVSGTLTVSLVLLAGPVAGAMGSPDSAPVIAVLAGTLVLAGIGVVPFALLQRRFDQRALFVVALVDLVVATSVTLGLLAAGAGVMSIAIGRLAAQSTATVLLFVLARVRPRFGLDRTLLRPVLGFAAPVAAANLLSWSVLGADKVVIASISGAVLLGVYVLAFNVSMWPMTAIGQVVRSLALPAFARAAVPAGRAVPGRGARSAAGAGEPAFERAFGLVCAAALLAGGMLSALAVPLVAVVYGAEWAAAAPVLVALGLVGATRVVFDLCASFLLARGRSRGVLAVQIAWLVATVGALVPATLLWGITGAAWASLAVSLVVVAPFYIVLLARGGCSPRALARAALPPLAAAVPTALVAIGLGALISPDWLAVLLGGTAATALYLLLLGRWARRTAAALRATPLAPSQTGVVHA